MATRADSAARHRLIRYALSAIAVVAVAWFVVGRARRIIVDAATTLLDDNAGQHAKTTRHTESLLSSAAFLSPGTDIVLMRAHLAMERHAWTRAARLATRRRPPSPAT